MAQGPSANQNSPNNGTVLSIVALICGVLGLTPTFGGILSIAGLITGYFGRKQSIAATNSTGKLLSTIAMIISSITLVIAIVSLLAFGFLTGLFSSDRLDLVDRFAGVWMCEGLNSYEIRREFLRINGRTTDMVKAKQKGDVVYIGNFITSGIDIVAGDNDNTATIVGKKCDRVQP